MSEIIVKNIRQCIAEKGLKQSYVAKKAGFTPQEFNNILCGRKKLNVEYIMPICNALSITANDLFKIAN